ncbi:hypothetical protein H4582DRAFT_2098472 [Lactarius indigo]|nr:hypothetical protein H4582DRAFT_2098472 [Lactarius indigo]
MGYEEHFRPWEVGRTEDQVRDVLARNHVADISTLERIAPAADHMLNIDSFISQINSWIHYVSIGLIAHLPGVSFDQTGPSQPIRFFSPSVSKGQTFTPQLVFLCRRLRRLCSYAPKLRDVINGQDNGTYQEMLESLRTLWGDADRGHSIVRQRHLTYLMERQLWRLQDLRDGSGFGFSVELFFLVLADLSSTASSWDTHSALHSIGTHRVILNLICDLARPDRGMFSNRGYPRYITDELLILVEGQSGSHVDDAMKELDAVPHSFQEGRLFGAEAMRAISRSRAPLRSS